MKRAVVIFMLLIYGSAAIGATVRIHYCMNKYIGSSLWNSSPAFCTNCGMAKEKSQGCCKDECKQVRLQADQQLNQAGYSLPDLSANDVLLTLVVNTTSNVFSPYTVRAVSHAPPGECSKKLYLQNSALLI